MLQYFCALGKGVKTLDNIYKIPVEQFTILQEKLAKINKRSKKCGTNGFDLVIHKTNINKIGNGEVKVTYDVSLTGEAPKIAGYTFIARLDHNTDPSGDSNLVWGAPGKTIAPEERNLSANCDHCNRKRSRRDTFLLKSDNTGKTIQVGRTCLADFLGHDPEQFLKYCRLLKAASEGIKGGNKPAFFMNNWRTVETEHFLAHVVMAIRHWGWVSSKEAYETGRRSTREDAWNAMASTNGVYKQQGMIVTDEDREEAKKALAWACEQDKTKSEFWHNLVTVAETGWVDYKAMGIAAAIIPMHQKVLEQAAKKTLDFSKSIYQGNKGERLNLTVLVYGKSYGTGSYGSWTRVSMIDTAGNIYVTFAGGKFDPDEGRTIKIRGTVKAHGEFKGIKQTNLNRVMEII